MFTAGGQKVSVLVWTKKTERGWDGGGAFAKGRRCSHIDT